MYDLNQDYGSKYNIDSNSDPGRQAIRFEFEFFLKYRFEFFFGFEFSKNIDWNFFLFEFLKKISIRIRVCFFIILERIFHFLIYTGLPTWKTQGKL